MKNKVIYIVITILVVIAAIMFRIIIRHPDALQKDIPMTQIATYMDVDYEIINIETSKTYENYESLNNHEFTLITINMTNNSDKVVNYGDDTWQLVCKSDISTSKYGFKNKDLFNETLKPNESKDVVFVYNTKIDSKLVELNFYKLEKRRKNPTFTFDSEG